jgi:hypothetical protein
LQKIYPNLHYARLKKYYSTIQNLIFNFGYSLDEALDYNKREDTTEILVNNIYIEEMIFSTGGPEIKINEKEKMTELMALCFVSGLEKELDAYDVRTTKEYNWRPIKS